jgi:cytoskeletal protein CcmA (bactofilin family)
MFKENKMKENPVLERNVIGKKTSIVGEIHSEGDFRIDGTVEGSIRAEGRVIIGKEGKVKGLIECTNADIEGEVTGDISVSDMLSLKSTAVIYGDVVIGKLTVEPGASFNATCSMKGMVKELNKNGSKKRSEKTA